MKERELREHTECSMCGENIGASGLPLFSTMVIERHGLKMDALQRQQGLGMMLGGHAELAQVMGPDEDMTQLMSRAELTICELCFTKEFVVAHLAESGDVEIPIQELT